MVVRYMRPCVESVDERVECIHILLSQQFNVMGITYEAHDAILIHFDVNFIMFSLIRNLLRRVVQIPGRQLVELQ